MGPVKVVGREAEIDAVDPLRAAGPSGELKMAAGRLQPSVLAGGGVLQALCGEVEGAARNDVSGIPQGSPDVALPDLIRTVLAELDAVCRGNPELPGEPLPLWTLERSAPTAQSQGPV